MSMTAFARNIGWGLHRKAAYIEGSHADVAADLREIATTVPADLRATMEARQIEMLNNYGYNSVPVLDKPFAFAEGVAFIPVHGMLINRMSWSSSYATGYNFIRAQMQAALADDDVALIVYDVNSAGGLASGCSELSNEIYESRGDKPSLAVVDARCYSAAYFLASACTKIVLTPTGGVGSIGCAAMHVEYSEMLKEEGINVTFIFAGAQKVDGNQYQALSARAKQSIQQDVDYHYGLFVDAVARNRDLSEDDVRATEAGCFLPPDALELGLIDAIKTPTEAVADFYDELTTDSETEVDFIMKTQETTGTAGAPSNVAPVSATVPAVTTGLSAEQVQAMVNDGVAKGISADRERSSSIQTCDEAKGRGALAQHLANTGMSFDSAKAILAAAPKEAEATETPKPAAGVRQNPNEHFIRAMDNTKNPNLSAENSGSEPGTEDTPQARASRLLGTYAGATGRKVIGLNDRSNTAA